VRAQILRALAGGALALVVIVGYWWLQAPDTTRVKVGDVAPELELPSLGGAEGVRSRLTGYRGGPVLVAMFLSTCPVCEADIPEIERLHREFVQKGLRVVGISVDADGAALQRFVDKHRLTFHILMDANGAAVRAAWGSWKFPEVYLLDPSGRVQHIWLGSTAWRSAEARAPILRALGMATP
jgi:peroxiredoxin